MEENILKININYEVGIDIDELANDMKNYLEDALFEQSDYETRDIILGNEMDVAALLNEVGKVWQKQFVQKIINNKGVQR